MTIRHRIGALAALGLLTSCATSTGPNILPWPEGAEESAARFEADLTTLSDDSFGGREAGTEGYDMAVDYVQAAFMEMGLAPAGDNGSYLQQVPLRRAYAIPEAATLSLSHDGEITELAVFEDFGVSPARTRENVSVEGEVVYVGYGIDAPQFGQTAYEDVDVEGKIIAVVPGVPEGLPSEEAAHFGSFGTKRRTAASHGAIGMLVLTNQPPSAQAREQMMAQAGFPTDMVRHPEGSYPRMDAVGVLNQNGVSQLLAASGLASDAALSGEAAAQSLGVTAQLSTQTRFEDYESPNVVGMIEGADRALRDEYVVLSAHLDHIGMLNTVEEGVDTINNGAMDNASGTATMLEAARKFMSGERPRRSVVFIALTAEEKGLLGSEYFANHPTIPAEGMVANVNLDMPILLHEFTDVIAFGAQHSTLKGLAEAAGSTMGVTISPDPVPQMVLFVRSDHYNFVKVGVPSIFLVLGFAEGGQESFQGFLSTNYHRPGDDASQDIRYDQGARFAELNFRIASEIANADEAPNWNDGDFFGDEFGRD